jgi:hypothetical protein
MLPDALNTNQIMDRTAAEVEFGRIRTADRTTEFAALAESPNQENRLKVSHQETGSGVGRRRRSVVRFDKQINAAVGGEYVPCSAYIVLDLPVGSISDYTGATDVLAQLLTFVGTLAGTTLLHDGTGNGAVALLHGTL